MSEEQWRRERDDRTLRYAGRRLDPERWIAITASSAYVWRYDGQVALLTACNLLGRMSSSIALAFPDKPVHPSLPWSNYSLHELILAQMRAADPYGRFIVRKVRPSDHQLHFGPDGAEFLSHGTGWNSYSGRGPSPLPPAEDRNPTGAAMAAIHTAANLFVTEFGRGDMPVLVNTLDWTNAAADLSPAVPAADLGSIFTIGTGSVGTAALYFLALANRRFAPTLIDMDFVKRWNLDRSPIFTDADVGRLKVDAAREFLSGAGFTNIRTESCALHEAETWTGRTAGTPDVVIAAANEQNVRYHIESLYPPIQLYGTTGRNWQASLIRHIPLLDACSCCLFPDDGPQAQMACASALNETATPQSGQVDAALPFLSFGAGLMAAAEILKLAMPGYPFSRNRVTMTTRPTIRLAGSRIPVRSGCMCGERNQDVHRKAVDGGRYAGLSPGRNARESASA